jgi:hypothetical protein
VWFLFGGSVQVLRELARIVVVGGLIDIHVWALEQEADSRRT